MSLISREDCIWVTIFIRNPIILITIYLKICLHLQHITNLQNKLSHIINIHSSQHSDSIYSVSKVMTVTVIC